MTRRDFLLSTTATAAALATRRSSSASTPIPALIPAIDTHTHFYDPTRTAGVPWPPKTDPILYRSRLPADFRALASPHGVVGAVIVEASEWVEDNQWILDLAKNDESIVGLVGHLVPGTPEFASNLRRFAADPLFRGLRLRASYLNKIADPAIAADLKRVADLDLSIDALGGVPSLAPTLALSRLLPSLRIVLDHVPFKDWDGNAAAIRPALAELARRPNVFAKISDVVRRVNNQIIDDPAHYRPALDELFDLFGPDRVVFGSNWPVSDRVAPYGTIRRVVADYFASKGPAVMEKYFWRNSHVAYRWLRRGAAASLVP